VTLEGHMDRLISQRRFNMALLVLFGILGLVITAASIYGVMAYAVDNAPAKSASAWRLAPRADASCRWCYKKPSC